MNKSHRLYQEDMRQILANNKMALLEGKSILVTGATGMLGVCLIDALMINGNVNVIAVGRSREKAKERLGEYYNCENFLFVEQDVIQPLPADLKPDYIIIGASNTHPLAFSSQPINTILTNIVGTKNALDIAVKCNAKVLFLSSGEIYGNSSINLPFKEENTGTLDLSTARASYTEAKRLCEALCQSYIAEKNLDVKIARLCRIFGPTMLMTDSKASSQFIKNALHQEDIILKSEGTQQYSYIYVAEAISAMLHILLCGKTGTAYNVSNALCDIRLKDFAAICSSFCDRQVVFEIPSEHEKKGYSIANYALLDNTKLKSIGFVPQYNIEDAICRTLKILS